MANRTRDVPNSETIQAIEESESCNCKSKSFDSIEELFEDLNKPEGLEESV